MKPREIFNEDGGNFRVIAYDAHGKKYLEFEVNGTGDTGFSSLDQRQIERLIERLTAWLRVRR